MNNENRWIMAHRDGMWWRGRVVGEALGGTVLLLQPCYSISETGEMGEAVRGQVRAQEQCVWDGEPLELPRIGTVILPCADD